MRVSDWNSKGGCRNATSLFQMMVPGYAGRNEAEKVLIASTTLILLAFISSSCAKLDIT